MIQANLDLAEHDEDELHELPVEHEYNAPLKHLT